MRRMAVLALLESLLLCAAALGAETQDKLHVSISWGHRSANTSAFYVKLLTEGVEISEARGQDLESDDAFRGDVWETRAGAGDVDGAEFILSYPQTQVKEIEKLHPIWADLIAQSDSDTARRLRLDPAYRPDSRKLTICMNPEGTKGFSVTADQLLQNKAFWVPSLDVYMTAGDPPVPFAEHQKELSLWEGKRILDQVHQEPEATYEQCKARWEDMGNPAYRPAFQPFPGHIVCLTWDSAIHKFGIDRGAGVWSDYGNPDRFRFWFDFGDLASGITESWKGQWLWGPGFPIITTAFEKDAIRYEVEQFAYPLNGPPAERRGDIPTVLMQSVMLKELSGQSRSVPVTLHHARKLPPETEIEMTREGGSVFIEDIRRKAILFAIDGVTGPVTCSGLTDFKDDMKRLSVTVTIELAPRRATRFRVKLPSPVVDDRGREALAALDYETARAVTLKFWADYEARGARFRVPEEAVNELFRANLWHALRLPRRHGGQEPGVRIDLPYSNFAYTQTGIPWPVNHSVYVDYMIYDLRGYHDIAAEELAAIFRENQEPNGHIKGYANWLVYTPSTLYAVAKNFLLSQDRRAFEQLLPASLKSMDWCLEQVRRAQRQEGIARGLVRGPLNDGTGDGYWAFNQAYMYAGLDLLGKALERFGHPRAEECQAAARDLQQSIDGAFRAAMVQSPLVQLRDHTYIPYVPCEATRPGRLLDQWYPTDVDTGPVHLVRLKAIRADSDLADSLLNDHEDNLYLHGWGMANEPVYNPQATAYLLRDDPEAVIRAFYSMMACAFSHSVYEPVEHRWSHGQYFGPPSTDGAWAELYRNMLIQELDDDTLLLFAATPRKWLEDGKKITIERAPTYYGKLSAVVESQADSGEITARIEMPGSVKAKDLLVRFRHPRGSPISSVKVNGALRTDFDIQKEWVRIRNPRRETYYITVQYREKWPVPAGAWGFGLVAIQGLTPGGNGSVAPAGATESRISSIRANPRRLSAAPAF